MQAGAVVVDDDDNFVALLPHVERQLAGLGLAGGAPLGGHFQSVHDRIANQVLKRPRHFLEHAAIELGRRATNIEIDALVELLRDLPRHSIQTLRHVRKRHQPHPHQLLLQITRQARLRGQIGVRALQPLQHVALDHRHVFDRLGQHARQLLQARIAVELERIEVRRFARQLVAARLDLRIGLDLDFAQLRTQPRNVFRQVGQRSLDRADFVFELRARDRDLARLIDQLVEHIGAHANERRRLLCTGCSRRQRGTYFAPDCGQRRRAGLRRRGARVGPRCRNIDDRRPRRLRSRRRWRDR